MRNIIPFWLFWNVFWSSQKKVFHPQKTFENFHSSYNIGTKKLIPQKVLETRRQGSSLQVGLSPVGDSCDLTVAGDLMLLENGQARDGAGFQLRPELDVARFLNGPVVGQLTTRRDHRLCVQPDRLEVAVVQRPAVVVVVVVLVFVAAAEPFVSSYKVVVDVSSDALLLLLLLQLL